MGYWFICRSCLFYVWHEKGDKVSPQTSMLSWTDPRDWFVRCDRCHWWKFGPRVYEVYNFRLR